MTVAKAKLYKTARIAEDIGNLEDLGFTPGEYVAVKYVGRGAFGLNFQVTGTPGESKFRQNNVVCLGEIYLTEFCL